jgi:hypothetical protein
MPRPDINKKFDDVIEILYERIEDLAILMGDIVTAVAKIDKKKALVDVLSYITPGMTDEIGRVNVKHYVLSLLRDDKVESIEASEAFKKVRPLWVGSR